MSRPKGKCTNPTVMVTVEPASEVGSVQLSLKQAIATMDDKMTDAETGRITFTLNGKAGATYATQLEAKIPNLSCTPKAEVKVIVPKSLKIEAAGPVPYVPDNQLLNKATTPAMLGVKPPLVCRCTVYNTIQNVQVLDQFGENLDAIYAGSDVEEQFGTTWHDINVTTTATGTYADPVGSYLAYGAFGSVEKIKPDSDKAKNWLKADTIQPTEDFTEFQKINVRVAGHLVGNAPRDVSVSVEKNMTIIPAIQ